MLSPRIILNARKQKHRLKIKYSHWKNALAMIISLKIKYSAIKKQKGVQTPFLIWWSCCVYGLVLIFLLSKAPTEATGIFDSQDF